VSSRPWFIDSQAFVTGLAESLTLIMHAKITHALRGATRLLEIETVGERPRIMNTNPAWRDGGLMRRLVASVPVQQRRAPQPEGMRSWNKEKCRQSKR
jgi:hypothetical protein